MQRAEIIMKREFIITAEVSPNLPRISFVNCEVDLKMRMFVFLLMLWSAFGLSFSIGLCYLQMTAVP